MKRRPAASGSVIVAVSTLWQAIGTVVIARTATPGSVMVSTFVAFASAAMISALHAGMTGRIPRLVHHLRFPRRVRLLVAMNLATAGVFLSFYAALAYASPLSVSVLEAGIAPLTVVIVCSWRPKSRPTRRARVSAVCVAGISIGIATRATLLHEQPPGSTWTGISLAAIAGISGAGVVLLSSQLNQSGFSPVDVNALRFHLSWVASGTLVLLNPVVPILDASAVSHVTMAVFFGGAPLIALQFGISKCSPIRSELILASLPSLVYLMELLSGNGFDPIVASLLLALLGVSVSSLVPIPGRGNGDSRKNPSKSISLQGET